MITNRTSVYNRSYIVLVLSPKRRVVHGGAFRLFNAPRSILHFPVKIDYKLSAVWPTAVQLLQRIDYTRGLHMYSDVVMYVLHIFEYQDRLYSATEVTMRYLFFTVYT